MRWLKIVTYGFYISMILWASGMVTSILIDNVDLSDIPVLDQFLLLKCGSEVLTDVLQQIIDRGVDFNDKHYLFYTSSTGQMKEKTITLVEENYWIENKYCYTRSMIVPM